MPADKAPQVKKVRAFPIPVNLTLGAAGTSPAAPPIPMNIVKLTQQGFLAETQVASMKLGEKGQVQFEIPVSHDAINEACVIVKHYSHWVEKDGGQVPGFLIEAHFHQLSEAALKKITSFLSSLRRTP